MPIDVIAGNPPKFRWRQTVSTPVGTRVVEHEGLIPPSLEGAVASLIGIAKQLAAENEALRGEAAAPKMPKFAGNLEKMRAGSQQVAKKS